MSTLEDERKDAILRASVDHWARLAECEPLYGETAGGGSCPLCMEYAPHAWDHGGCGECPVKMKTGKPGCASSPWMAANTAWFARKMPQEERYERFRAMLAFLVELLPGGHQ